MIRVSSSTSVAASSGGKTFFKQILKRSLEVKEEVTFSFPASVKETHRALRSVGWGDLRIRSLFSSKINIARNVLGSHEALSANSCWVEESYSANA